MLQILLIALSLSLDAFAVALSAGVAMPAGRWRQGVKMGLWFGVFQWVMPLLGYFLGRRVSDYIGTIGPWVACALLVGIGGRMGYSALKQGSEQVATYGLSTGRLAALATATSVDALAAGVSMAFMDVNIYQAAAMIGAVAFAMSMVGGVLGQRLGHLFQRRAELGGGLVLIAMGVKLLLEHCMH